MILNYKKANIFEAGTDVKLMPGVNADIKQDAWNKCKDHPIVKHMIDEGHIEILAEDEADILDVLAKSTPAAAIQLVKETVQIEMLERMQDAEKRKAVSKAIADQIKELKTIEYRDQTKEADETAAAE